MRMPPAAVLATVLALGFTIVFGHLAAAALRLRQRRVPCSSEGRLRRRDRGAASRPSRLSGQSTPETGLIAAGAAPCTPAARPAVQSESTFRSGSRQRPDSETRRSHRQRRVNGPAGPPPARAPPRAGAGAGAGTASGTSVGVPGALGRRGRRTGGPPTARGSGRSPAAPRTTRPGRTPSPRRQVLGGVVDGVAGVPLRVELGVERHSDSICIESRHPPQQPIARPVG